MEKFGGKLERHIPVIIEDGKRVPMLARKLFASSLHVITEPGKYQGWLAHPKWNVTEEQKKGKRFFPSDVAHVIVPDVYWQFRLFTHGTEKYQQDKHGEIPRLVQSLQHLHELHGLLLGKLDPRRVDLLRQEIKREAITVVAFLGPNANEAQKKRAIEQAIAVATGKDSLDRFNPGAFAARIVAAINAVLIRESDAISINAIFAQWRRLDQSMLCVMDFEVDAQYTFLQRVLSEWDSLIRDRQTAMRRRLVNNAALVQAYDLNPFRETFTYVAQEYLEADGFLATNRPSLAKPLLETAFASLGLRKIRVDLEKAMHAVSRKVRFPIVPFPWPNVRNIIAVHITTIEKLQTVHMRAFDKQLVIAGLRDTIASLEKSEYEQAHDRFRQTIRLI